MNFDDIVLLISGQQQMVESHHGEDVLQMYRHPVQLCDYANNKQIRILIRIRKLNPR
jgi:hypothetical protein